MRTLGKRVKVNSLSRVRIPLSPPLHPLKPLSPLTFIKLKYDGNCGINRFRQRFDEVFDEVFNKEIT
ncbi:uncharacterized protein METZ01_LOCUS490321 [marine metagenome]|uniref:Uncharacterized protein n=1 Tax=marine metagenome TaxID=408172 RepID=A0A383CYT3_9ZZZZ